MQHIKLSTGDSMLVDNDNFIKLSKFRWCLTNGYPSRRVGNKIVYLHRIVNKTPEGIFTDHINGDKLDNRRSNLRSCSYKQNSANKGFHKNSTSGFKGVSWFPRYKKWVAQITVNYKHLSLGYFKKKTDAAHAYNMAAQKYFGEFAKLNKI